LNTSTKPTYEIQLDTHLVLQNYGSFINKHTFTFTRSHISHQIHPLRFVT